MLANWLQIEMDKTLKIKQVDHNDFKVFNYNFFLFFMYLKNIRILTLDFKFFIIQFFNILA